MSASRPPLNRGWQSARKTRAIDIRRRPANGHPSQRPCHGDQLVVPPVSADTRVAVPDITVLDVTSPTSPSWPGTRRLGDGRYSVLRISSMRRASYARRDPAGRGAVPPRTSRADHGPVTYEASAVPFPAPATPYKTVAQRAEAT